MRARSSNIASRLTGPEGVDKLRGVMDRREQISGAMVRGHIEALRVRIGSSAYDEIFAQLSLEDREELMLVTPLSWVHIAALERLYIPIAARSDTTVESLHTEIASKVVGRAVTTIWKALLRFTSDQGLVTRAPLVFKRAYRQGKLEVMKAEPGHAILHVSSWPGMSEFAIRGFRVGIESTLRAAGRRDPKGTSHATPDGAVLELAWAR